ncbi:uncharacterized protein LOC132557089 [Ylistrum balloti]|uniref:uncharacterized protein LOC132557089 n=1 Tax=Ylistrum balloti TaxID=509963 RepID=UPI002905F6CA|nr:uncharacterized protein LOC132557089 [Ylistrum balloti]
MATGDVQITLRDLEADTLPVYGSDMDMGSEHRESCILSQENAILPEANASKVSNLRFWRKKPGDIGLDFLKSLWDCSSVSTPKRLESRVSVDGEKTCITETRSDEEDETESFRNDLTWKGPNRGHFSSTSMKGNNSELLSRKMTNVSNLEQLPQHAADKSGKNGPMKPPRAVKGNFEIPSHHKIDRQDISASEFGISDGELDFLSEQNFSEEDVCLLDNSGNLMETNLLIYNDDDDGHESFLHYNETHFEVKDRAGQDTFEGHDLENHTFESHIYSRPMSSGQYTDGQRQDSRNYLSFETDANMPREMFPPQSESRIEIPERGGNQEVDPFQNTFSREISYGDSNGIESYSAELPNRRPNSSHEYSETCHHGNPLPSKDTARNLQTTRKTVLINKGCGNCQNCRASKMFDNMEKLAESAGFDIQDVLPDGNCMFRAIVDQLRMRGDLTMTAGKLRENVIQYLRDNPCSEDGTHMQMFLPTEKWEDYLSRMEKDGEWGDEMALRGISEVIKRQINIISAIGSDQHNQITIQPTGVKSDPTQDLFLGHMDDYHYISLRPKNWEDTWFVRARQRLHQTKADQHSDESIRVSGMDAPVMRHGSPSDYFADDKAVDELSGTPISHLSYVLKSVLNSKYLDVQDAQMWDDKMASINSHPRSSTIAIAVGSIVEKFAVSLQDKSPLQIGYSLRSNKIATANLHEISPHLLILNPYYHVMEHRSDEKSSLKNFVMETVGLHPGYLRLHQPIKTSDVNSRGQVMITYMPNAFLDTSNVRKDIGSYQLPDFVEENVAVEYALEAKFWPDCAFEWKKRERPSGWPKPEFIQSIIDAGFLVTTGSHPHSDSPQLEFQISFAKAEKLLARRNMTKCQRYCFHIFKVLVDFHTRQTPFLSTNYLKMIFFYASEVVPRSQWRLNPGAAMFYLMDRLLHCLRTKKLPHYFIPSNNMIDHLSDDVLQRMVTHLEAVRQFPVTSIILLAEAHGLSSSWMSDPIINDIPAFTKHRDLQKSFAEVFIPTTLKNAINYVKYMMLQPAADIIMEAYQDMKSAGEAKPGSADEWCVGNIFEFIHQILSELHFFQQFWLCLVLDMTHGTSTVTALTERLPGKTIKEILGNDEEGELDKIQVPFSLMENSCASKAAAEDESDPELTFLHSLATHLVNMQYYELSSHYLRASVSLTKRKIAEITKHSNSSSEVGQMDDSDQRSPQLNSLDFTRQHQLKMYLNNFLVQLFNSYHYNGQTELFQEYVSDLQEVCDSISAPYAYRNLSRIWGYLGCDDRAQNAADRMEELFQLCGV